MLVAWGDWTPLDYSLVNEFKLTSRIIVPVACLKIIVKLTIVRIARPNLMQICACAWIYRWTKNLEIRTGSQGHILVPRAHNHSDLRQGSRALAGPDFLSPCKVFVSCSQRIWFARFDGKSMSHGLPVLDKARALDPSRRSEWSWALGMRMTGTELWNDCTRITSDPVGEAVGAKISTLTAHSEWKTLQSLEFAVKFQLVFRYEAVVFRRYVLSLLLVVFLRKFVTCDQAFFSLGEKKGKGRGEKRLVWSLSDLPKSYLR